MQSPWTIHSWAVEEARNSGLPGWTGGPADAYRHLVGAAELARQYGPTVAWTILEANEFKGSSLPGYAQTDADKAMDRHHNLAGVEFGMWAKSREEIAQWAKDQISKTHEANEKGEKGPAVFLPPSEWRERPVGPNDTPPTNWPPKWGGEGDRSDGDAGNSESKAMDAHSSFANRALAKRDEDWTKEDARAVMNDPRYFGWSHPDQKAIGARVQRYFERAASETMDGGGTVQVAAYTRDDGTQVDAHTRAPPQRKT
ncbi:MAG: hypothetical protein ACKO1J_16730 [Tagaea sp.]